jgi:hypothetical protein
MIFYSQKGGNDMSVLAVVEAQVKSDHVSDMKAFMAEILPDTRVYDGCFNL